MMPPSANPSSAVEHRAIERAMLARALHLHVLPFRRHDDVHVDLGPHVLRIVEIEPRFAIDHADAHRRDATLDRRCRDLLLAHEPVEGIHDGDARAGDRRGARAAVGLQHVAVHLDREFAELEVVEHRAKTPSNESLNLLRAAADLRALARGARVRRAREHRVLRRHPPLALAALPSRYAILDARRAQHARVAARDQTGALGVRRRVAHHLQRAERIECTTNARGSFRSHEVPR